MQDAARRFRIEFVAHTWERFAEVEALRYEVLHAPFGVPPSEEPDEEDTVSEHIVALAEDGRVVGCGRSIERGSEIQLRQIAVASDRQMSGIGRALMQALIDRSLERGATAIWLNARLPAVGFYERLGFGVTGEVFLTGKAGLPHRRMEYRQR